VLPALVDPEWLSPRLGDADLVVADVRWYLDGRSGRAAYESGHLPGSVFVDLDRELSAKGASTEGRHPLPSPESFAEVLGRHGIRSHDAVVAYDDTGGGSAARLVWMLRRLGQPAALLDGGLGAWLGPLEGGVGIERPPCAVAPRPWPAAALAGVEEVASLAPGVVLVDARAPERFRGEIEPVDPRPGHVPGARNLPWTSVLDPWSGRFGPVEFLRARFAAVGVEAGTPVIASCGSGVSACALLLAHEHAGLGEARLFVASYSGWSNDPQRPVVAGPDSIGTAG
jgi:thiosulfate/3-mercaptopyruvate sulfurtransferase